jgi:hypothetical protein
MNENAVSVKRPLVCAAKISRKQIKEYLFRDKAGAEADENVREHVTRAGCAACQWLVDEIVAAEPYLRDDETLPAPRLEVLEKRPIDDKQVLEQEKLIAEVASKLASALATHTQEPFSMEALFAMNGRIRSVMNPVKRQTIAQDVMMACDARQKGLGVDAAVAAAADRLMTFITREPALSEVSLGQLGLKKDLHVRKFLLYMMTNEWFLNWNGASTWVWTKEGAQEGEFPLVSLRLTELKSAFAAYAKQKEAGMVRA